MSTHKDVKTMARSLRIALARRKVPLSHGESLEIVAHQFGFKDWNTLTARLPVERDAAGRKESAMATTPVAMQSGLSCSFCGKLQHQVRSLIEGGCTRPRQATHRCVFICDECVELCAQVNADFTGDAKARDRVSSSDLPRKTT